MRSIQLVLLVFLLHGCDSGQLSYTDGGGSTLVDGSQEPDGVTCGSVSQQAELPPLDLLIALDTSFSMDFDGKWIAVTEALKTFATDPLFSAIGVGLQYFPLRAQCKVDDYASPAVPIAPLSQISSAFISSLDAQQMYGGTPMVPLLQGAMAYMRAWAAANAGRKVAIVLATDGIPDNTCQATQGGVLPNTLDNVVEIASEGASSSPMITTFVIGVGSELTALNQIALAGSAGDAFLVDTDQDIKQAFLAALNDIRRTMSCEFAIPPPPGGEMALDFDEVNVRFSSATGEETFLRVEDKEDCASSPGTGWYYDMPDKPTKIILCDDACQRVQTSEKTKVEVLFGCKTQVA